MLLKSLTITILLSVVFETESSNTTSANLGKKEDVLRWETLENALKRTVDSYLTSGNLFRLLYNITNELNISSGCRIAINEEVIAFRNLKEWAIRMVDASGKLPSGVLDGTVMDLGSFDSCLRIRVNQSGGREAFRGRHCMLGFRSPMLLPPIGQKTPERQSYVDAYGHPPDWVGDLNAMAGADLQRAAFWIGICAPSTCSEEDIKKIALYVTKPLKLDVLTEGCQIDEPLAWPTSAIISVCILCVFIGLCTLGTLIDAVTRHLSSNPQYSTPDYLFFHILAAFSLLSNTEKLFGNINEKDVLGCFHGLRFLSAAWIIFGHIYFVPRKWRYLVYRNGLTVGGSFKGYLHQAVLDNFTISVDSFFFMSGFLLVYGTWRKLESSNGKINLLKFFIHKYWRMTPALGLMMMLFLVLPLVGSGPLWHSTLDAPVHNCEQHWWANLLYINNLFDTVKGCSSHTWFLAALMQYNIVGVFLLIFLYRWPLFGSIFGFTIAAGSCSLTALLVIWNNFPMPALGLMKDSETNAAYCIKIYYKPFSHASPYLIGMLVAYFFRKHKDKQIKIGYQILGWSLATAAAFCSFCGVYGPSENVEVRALYMACYRIGWGASVGWLVFACSTGHGGIINRFLSWKAFAPLGHLSYLAYLLHPLIMLYRLASLRERMGDGRLEMVFDFLAYTVLAFFLAFIGHVAVEKPFLVLDGLIFKKRSSHTSKTSHTEELPTIKPIIA